MTIERFKECNVAVPQLGNAPAFVLEENGATCIITMWKPSEADKKAIAAGKPIFLQVYKSMTPTMLYTLNDEGKPNI